MNKAKSSGDGESIAFAMTPPITPLTSATTMRTSMITWGPSSGGHRLLEVP
jgi:hypothetical protein